MNGATMHRPNTYYRKVRVTSALPRKVRSAVKPAKSTGRLASKPPARSLPYAETNNSSLPAAKREVSIVSKVGPAAASCGSRTSIKSGIVVPSISVQPEATVPIDGAADRLFDGISGKCFRQYIYFYIL